MTSKVFIVNEPLKLDQATRMWSRSINLAPARRFGELVHLLPAGQLPDDPRPSVEALQRGLAAIRPTDYLLLVGDPRAIAWASAIAADNLDGELRLLQWYRSDGNYRLITCNVFAEEMVA